MCQPLNARQLPDTNKILTLFTIFWLAFAIENVATAPEIPAPDHIILPAFSATKTIAITGRLLPEQSSHPVGTELNKLVAERIINEFSAIGIEAESQQRFQCKNAARASAVGCAELRNIIVTLPGTNPDLEEYVTVSAHYDSQAATPGIADDLAGVATMIELASYFKHNPVEHNLLFLITDSLVIPGILCLLHCRTP